MALFSVATIAQEVRIDSFGFTAEGHFEVHAASEDPTAYYRLLQGETIDQLTQVVGLSLDGTLITRLPVTGNQSYFRLHEVPLTESLDADQDGLSDAFELRFGLDPFLVDSDGNGINDVDEDLDGDTLDGRAEQAAGTDPFDPDTDKDGWPDEAEVTAGSDPLDPQSRPILTLLAWPRTEVIAPAAPVLEAGEYGLILASPGSELVLPEAPALGAGQIGLILADPRTELVLPVGGDDAGITLGLLLAQPPVSLTVPVAPDLASGELGLVLARPIAEIVLPTSTEDSDFEPGVVLGRPPVSLELDSP
ncbi:MAG TPA: hypothetical protein VMS21_15875 [Methylomirabilota bacterium]|nr:hypothetical protein [Methylomirabilota bacterium]